MKMQRSTLQLCAAMSPPRQQHPAPALARVLEQLQSGDMVFTSMRVATHPQPLEHAIHQTGTATMDWLKHRGVAVSSGVTAQHVGLVVGDDFGQPFAIVEAVRLIGVRLILLDAFFAQFASPAAFLHGRVDGASDAQRHEAVSYALRRVGSAYAEDFAPPNKFAGNPLAQEFYCSSLIDYAYRHAFKQELVFTEEPFPLMWRPRSFWEVYYRSRGREIPEAIGSNPTLLLHSHQTSFCELKF